MHYMASSPPSVTRHYQGGFLLLPMSHMSAVCQRVRVGQDEQQGTPLQDGGGGAGRRGREGGAGGRGGERKEEEERRVLTYPVPQCYQYTKRHYTVGCKAHCPQQAVHTSDCTT